MTTRRKTTGGPIILSNPYAAVKYSGTLSDLSRSERHVIHEVTQLCNSLADQIPNEWLDLADFYGMRQATKPIYQFPGIMHAILAAMSPLFSSGNNKVEFNRILYHKQLAISHVQSALAELRPENAEYVLTASIWLQVYFGLNGYADEWLVILRGTRLICDVVNGWKETQPITNQQDTSMIERPERTRTVGSATMVQKPSQEAETLLQRRAAAQSYVVQALLRGLRLLQSCVTALPAIAKAVDNAIAITCTMTSMPTPETQKNNSGSGTHCRRQ